jgi:hypothetical protein
MKMVRDIVKKNKHSTEKSEEVSAGSSMQEIILLCNQRPLSLKLTGQVIDFRDEEVVKGRKKRKQYTSRVRIPEPEKIDEQFDVKVDGIYYRVFVNYQHNLIGWNEIVSFDYDGKGMPLLRNPAFHKELVKGLRDFVRDSDTPENLKINSIKYFAENEIKRIKEQRLKTKPKPRTKGRSAEDYLRKATNWSINHHNPTTEIRTETIRRAHKLYKDKAQSEEAFIKSVMNRWNSLSTLYKKKKGEGKITSDFKTYAKNRLKKPKSAHKQRIKKNQEGKI